jgi:hypothetical protein
VLRLRRVSKGGLAINSGNESGVGVQHRLVPVPLARRRPPSPRGESGGRGCTSLLCPRPTRIARGYPAYTKGTGNTCRPSHSRKQCARGCDTHTTMSARGDCPSSDEGGGGNKRAPQTTHVTCSRNNVYSPLRWGVLGGRIRISASCNSQHSATWSRLHQIQVLLQLSHCEKLWRGGVCWWPAAWCGRPGVGDPTLVNCQRPQ